MFPKFCQNSHFKDKKKKKDKIYQLVALGIEMESFLAFKVFFLFRVKTKALWLIFASCVKTFFDEMLKVTDRLPKQNRLTEKDNSWGFSFKFS